MNPEEGELRPQLLDRFGLCVEVRGLADPILRQEVVKRRLAFEHSPDDFVNEYQAQEEALGRRIEEAGKNLSAIALPEEALSQAVKICLTLGVDGHRGDLTVIKTALTLAAWKAKPAPDADDLMEAAELALPNRMRRKPFQDVDFDVKGRLADY
jgi:Mg-chelatase subunit ChlI